MRKNKLVFQGGITMSEKLKVLILNGSPHINGNTAVALRELQKAYPQHEFTLVIGEDNIAIFNQWKEYEFILENFRIFVYPRKGSALIEDCKLRIEDFKELKFLSGAPLFNISSTVLRQRGNYSRQ